MVLLKKIISNIFALILGVFVGLPVIFFMVIIDILWPKFKDFVADYFELLAGSADTLYEKYTECKSKNKFKKIIEVMLVLLKN